MKRILKNSSGITLIALIITIIVMLILAGVSISTLTGENGVLTRAERAVEEQRAAEEKESQDLDSMANIIDKYAKDNEQSESNQTPDNEQTESNKIPDGGTYYVGVTSTTIGDYTGATATYTAGQEFPETVNAGDVYLYGDYEYKYNFAYLGGWYDVSTPQASELFGGSGWGARVIDNTKSSYDKMLDEINSEPVSYLAYTFGGCKSLNVVPYISKNATTLLCMMSDCDAIQDVSSMVIPNKVISVEEIFYGCDLLKNSPDFSQATSLKTINYMFGICPEVEVAPNLQNCTNLTDVSYAFGYCDKLRTYTGSTDPDGDFSNYIIPSKTENMRVTFIGCKLLTKAPIIPSNVTNMYSTFADCTSLTGTITINTNNITDADLDGVGGCGDCFKNVDMTNITLTGSASNDVLNLIGGTGNNYTPIT